MTAAMPKTLVSSTLCLVAFMVMLVSCGQEDSGETIPQYVKDILPRSSPFQRDILRDGTVTPSEYEKAVLATVGCLSDQGVRHSTPLLTGAPPKQKWRYTYDFELADKERVDAVYRQCFGTYEETIAAVWSIQSAPTEEEQQRQKKDVVTCLADRGQVFANYEDVIIQLPTLSSPVQRLVTACQLLIFQGRDINDGK